MTWICPECRAAVDADQSEDESGEGTVTCPFCGKRTKPHSSEGGDKGPGVCPKCGAERTSRPDCPRCGLVFDRWDPESLVPAPDPVLDPVWEVLESSFDDPERHNAFLEMARTHGKLDGAAARYRRYAQIHGESQVVRDRLDEIRTLTLSRVFEPTRPRKKREKRPTSRAWIWLLLLFALAAIAFYVISSYSTGGKKPAKGTSTGPGTEPVNLKK